MVTVRGRRRGEGRLRVEAGVCQVRIHMNCSKNACTQRAECARSPSQHHWWEKLRARRGSSSTFRARVGAEVSFRARTKPSISYHNLECPVWQWRAMAGTDPENCAFGYLKRNLVA